jgi:L,D-transpeptidase ErfK/SrfK
MVAHIRLMHLILLLLLTAITTTAYAKPYGTILCKQEGFSCYIAKQGDTWSKLFNDPQQLDLVMRLNRTNLPITPGMRVAIPHNIDQLNMLDVAPFKKQIHATGKKSIYVSLQKLAFGAYNEEGQLEYWGPVSGGQGWCPDTQSRCHTASGQFSIYEKRGKGCFSTKFPLGRGGAPMPYCMFFYKGFALHGSPTVPGYNASHGCVRLFVNDAKWLNQEFIADESRIPVYISS